MNAKNEKITLIIDKINPFLNKSKFPGMTYEQGVEDTLYWIIGEIEDNEFPPLAEY